MAALHADPRSPAIGTRSPRLVPRVAICDPDLARSFVRVVKKAIDYRAANLDRTVELTSALIHVPVEVLAPVAKSRLLLTGAQLDAFTRDGTVDRWLARFNAMFKEFGTVADPLRPSEYYDGSLFLSA